MAIHGSWGGYTGESCEATGTYRSDCPHNHRTELDTGHYFPACQPCDAQDQGGKYPPHSLHWSLVNTPDTRPGL